MKKIKTTLKTNNIHIQPKERSTEKRDREGENTKREERIIKIESIPHY